MRIGIDVGGTHTDAVIVGENGIVSAAKVVTDHDHLLTSVLSALTEVIKESDSSMVSGVTLSTTLTTNAILEGKIDKVGVIVSSGPGIDPANYSIGDSYFVIEGSIDHRGEERKKLERSQIEAAVKSCKSRGMHAYAVVTKFSTRNPDHELAIEEGIGEKSGFITAGHRLSGGLNFPRRITTAYYNSAAWSKFNAFASAAEEGVLKLGIKAPINVLKADGGTMTLAASRVMPVQSILSGPAASIMGIAALCPVDQDAVVLDIGGTSTDIAVFAAGAPLLERDGIALNGRQTLVRSLRTVSIPLGGDSRLRIKDGRISVGPDRTGPCMAAGGKETALTDALNVSGDVSFGNVSMSGRGISNMAKQIGKSSEEAAEEAICRSVAAIADAVNRMIRESNERPVYTIHELLHTDLVLPSKLYIIGGPANALARRLSLALGMETEVPAYHNVANAIGAALTRTTMELELFADTERKVLFVPTLSLRTAVSGNYSLNDARRDAREYLLGSLNLTGDNSAGTEAQITEASSFNMIRGAQTAGKNIRVRCQIKPGHIQKYLDAVRSRC
jgi:N-methylhydantoinase A/oxoprolinase/acetone carboxylase beta subunit